MGLNPGPGQATINACGHVCKYVDQKGSAAMLTSIQSAGVATEVNLRITQARKHARNPPWLWNPGQTSPEVQNRGISGPSKNFKKKNYKNGKQVFYKLEKSPTQKRNWLRNLKGHTIGDIIIYNGDKSNYPDSFSWFVCIRYSEELYLISWCLCFDLWGWCSVLFVVGNTWKKKRYHRMGSHFSVA